MNLVYLVVWRCGNYMWKGLDISPAVILHISQALSDLPPSGPPLILHTLSPNRGFCPFIYPSPLEENTTMADAASSS